MFYTYLLLICNLSEFIPLIILFRYNYLKYGEIFIPLLDFIIFKFAVMIFAETIGIINTVDIKLTTFFLNAYSIFYFVTISKVYRIISNESNKQLFYVGNFIFFVVLVFSCFWLDFRYDFLNYLVSAINLIFAAYGIVFFTSSQNDILSIRFKKYYWFNIAFLTYNVCMFPAMFFDHLLMGDLWLSAQQIMWSIVLVSGLLLNIFLSIFILEFKFVSENK
jgi:hypothetical protein